MRIFITAIAMLAIGSTAEAPRAQAATAAEQTTKNKPQETLLEVKGKAGTLKASLEARISAEQVSSVPVDASGETFEAGALLRQRVRPGLVWSTERTIAPFYAKVELEADLHEGTIYDAPTLFGPGYPGTDDAEMSVRRAAVTLSLGGMLNLTGGYLTSHWGLGLIANDGAHGWKPGSANFTHTVGGDRVLRAMVSTSPLPSLGLTAAAAYDVVQDDDALLEGDEASQWVAALIYGMGKPDTAGVYMVSRHQESSSGAMTHVVAIDAMAMSEWPLGPMKLYLAAEAAMVMGGTDLGPNAVHNVHDLSSLGGVLRAGLQLERWGVWFDAAYASGDQNADDDQVNAFKTDPNFQQGMLLHRYVMASQTARAPHTASNPDLVGVPADDLDRLPTRGAFTNTISAFPRIWWRPFPTVELYGGALIALSPVSISDPLESRLAGGVPTNALGGSPGAYLGTELDAGVRWSLDLDGLQLGAALEAGLFLPGDAFIDPAGETMEPVSGTRLTLTGRL